jgi:hypothetical protein
MTNFAHRISRTLLVIALSAAALAAQDAPRPVITSSGIRIGERLTYNVSFQNYDNLGFAELFAVSRGKLGDADALELRMKLKTTGLLSAAFFQIDESRTTFANPDSGMPLLVKRQDNSGIVRKEVVSNYMASPAAGLDLITLIYKARQAAGAGSFVLIENDKTYSITFQPQPAVEHLRTDAGEFDTSVSIVQSEYLTEHGIQSLKINLSNDDAHVPVSARLKTAKGEVKMLLSGLQFILPETDAESVPAQVIIPIPRPIATPKPTPTPYIDNQPLSDELGFALGETLKYRVSAGERLVGEVELQAKERKLISGQDSLILDASVVSAEQGNGLFTTGDSLSARVNPETLSPFEFTARTSGALAGLGQTLRFDQRTGAVSIGGARIDAPVGTHTFLSLLYAVRSFNLNPSKDARSPVNDTRVAVFWQDKAYIFMLRPFESDTVTLNGQKMSAQKISIKTGVPQLDQLGVSVWLSNEQNRVPLVITVGGYRAELISRAQSPIK